MGREILFQGGATSVSNRDSTQGLGLTQLSAHNRMGPSQWPTEGGWDHLPRKWPVAPPPQEDRP